MKLRKLMAGLLAATLFITTGASFTANATDVVDDGTGWELDISEDDYTSDNRVGWNLLIQQEEYSVVANAESTVFDDFTDGIAAVYLGDVSSVNGLKIAGVDIGYDEGSYFTKNGKSCVDTYWAKDSSNLQRCHHHGVCVDATHAHCNCMRYWPSKSNMQVDLLASQCLGYARFCQWKVYGYHDGNKSGSFSNLGSLSSSNCTAAKVKNLLNGCGAATHVRTNSGHSISIINYTDNSVEWTDCNSDGLCKVRHRTSTWSEFATILKGYDGVSYANSGNTKPNGTISEHIHNYSETGTEAAHPHKEYKKCSCGVFYYTGNTSYRSNCSECNGSSGCSCSTSYAGQYIVSTNSAPLTIRSGHGTSYTAVGSIPKGTEVTVTKANGSWAHVTYNGVSGCVSMEYLKGKYITDNLYPTPINCYPLSEDQHAADAYDSVGGTHIGYIYGSDFCTIKEIYNNGWCLVNCPWSGYSNGRNVYAYTGAFIYLDSVGGKAEQLIAENTSDTYRRAGSNDWLGGSRSWVDAGDTILKVGVYGDRTQIVYPNGVGTHSMGWVPSSALVHTHTPGSAATCTMPQVCTKCDAVITPALGHTPGAAATCTNSQTCTRCGTTINNALGHSYDAQTYYEIAHPHKIYKVCTRCGVTQYTGGTTTYDDCTTCFPVPTSVTLNKTSATLKVGDTLQLTETVSPTNAVDKAVTWSSGNTSVATVSTSGLVTAKATGNAIITVTTNTGNKTAQCSVTVSSTTPTGVTLNKETATISVGKTLQLTATVSPSNATNKDVTWSTSDNKVAIVDANGLVTAYNAGTATITVKTVDGGKTATCKVTVSYTESEITGPVKTITHNGHTYSVYEGTVSWITAKQFCNDQGGYLATITSAEEHNAIKNVVPTNGYWFLGGYKENDKWKWVTGEAFAYESWYTGQPDNNYNGTELYLGLWNNDGMDFNDFRLFIPSISGFIMEAEPSQILEGPHVIVESTSGRPGSTVAVTVKLLDNQGITGARLSISYPDGFTLTGIETGVAFSDLDFTKPVTPYLNPVTLSWDGLANDNHDGTLAILTFEVSEGMVEGSYPITVTYNEGDVYDEDLENVSLRITNGVVDVLKFMYGDVNNDGAVNGKDVTLIRRYISGGFTIDVFNKQAADVNKDNTVNGKDVTLIRRYISGGFGVVLG